MSKKWIYLAGAVVIAFLAFFMYQKYKVAPAINFAQLSLVDLENKPVNILSYKGRKLVVCFSASWCGNCREELDVIASVKDRDLNDVDILVISDESLEKITGFKERRQYPFIFLKMDKPFNEIGIQSIPTTYIVNRNLEVKKETVGYMDWKDPSTLEHLRKLME